MAKNSGLREKMFKATFYIVVDEKEAGHVVTEKEVFEFLYDALIVDVDTEEYGNPVGFKSAEVNIDKLEEIIPV